MGINIRLVVKTLKLIRENPEHWDQSTFYRGIKYKEPENKDDFLTCGTTFCFAGWAFMASGEGSFQWENSGFPEEWVLRPVTEQHTGVIEVDAAKLLGFNEEITARIFFRLGDMGVNDIDNFEQFVWQTIYYYGQEDLTERQIEYVQNKLRR